MLGVVVVVVVVRERLEGNAESARGVLLLRMSGLASV
jgi:hypothetical protein